MDVTQVSRGARFDTRYFLARPCKVLQEEAIRSIRCLSRKACRPAQLIRCGLSLARRM